MKTLVVEDSSSMRALLCELLGERNHMVTAVGTAEEALQAHRADPFDLMLIDWNLPGMSGLDLCRMVRSRPQGHDVVILVVTGKSSPEDLQSVLDAGASDYLPKPIAPELLHTRLLVAERTAQEAQKRRTSESRLVFADRMASVGTLAAGVAHELNNPLMYVLSNLRLTREEIDSAAEPGWLDRAKRQIDEAIYGARRMQDIVRDLKAFSRVDDEVRSNLDLKSVLESSINMCWNEIRHRATLERDLTDTPPVDGSESRLGQVFLNLLINASQALPDRRVEANRITVRAFTDNKGWATVEVSDNGEGIPEEAMSQIFDPFYTTKGIAEGTGLGLSICKSIVQSMGGSITAHSQPGQGTTFRVRLPPSEGTQVRRKKRAPAVGPSGVKARVVVVDDEPLVGRSIRRALRHHEVRVFTSGKEAIETLCSDSPIDIVFCDIMMPEMSGMEVFEIVQARRPEIATRFVFMTGGAFTPKARDFVEATAVLCLEKPFELAQIRDLVTERIEPAA